MEVISIERSTYEELLTSFNSFVTKMKEMASRGNDKGLLGRLARQSRCVSNAEHQPENITNFTG